MRILVCGGREFGDLAEYREEQHHKPDSYIVRKKEKEYKFIFDTLESIAREFLYNYPSEERMLPSEIEIISGCAKGADSVGVDWAAANWLPCRQFPADWETHGKAAGPIRNQQMLDEGKPDLVVAFPGGRGTADMVRRAKKAGVEVRVIEYPL